MLGNNHVCKSGLQIQVFKSVILRTVEEKDYISILLYGTGLSQMCQLRFLLPSSCGFSLTVELGKRHNSHYVTPYGELMIGIDAVSIENGLTENGGTLRMAYSIDYYAAVAATKEITIDIII